jgi:hypothetical protein
MKEPIIPGIFISTINFMERKTIICLLTFALLASFFFPIFNWNSYDMSGPNYILSDFTPSYKYFLISIPLISIIILLDAWYNENLMFTRRLVWIPLLVLLIVFTLSAIIEGFRNVLAASEVGFWMILLASLSLGFVATKRRTSEFID